MSTTVNIPQPKSLIPNGKVAKVEHVLSKPNDRWIYVEYNDESEVIGLNFMQGEDDYELFKREWCYRDYALTEFYHYMLSQWPIERQSITKYDFMNSVMWTFITAERCIEDFGGDTYNNSKTLSKIE